MTFLSSKTFSTVRFSSAMRTSPTNLVVIRLLSTPDDGRGDFLDSFGRRPDVDFERYMNCHCASWNFNDKQLASFLVIIVFISVFFVVDA